VIPNTVLEAQMKENGIDLEQINANYTSLRPTFSNVLLYVLLVWRIPGSGSTGSCRTCGPTASRRRRTRS